ncbi:plasmid partition protein ParG [Pseudomonas putida]|uniref:plasmid partition protein ParG n=1 Tax=Pseudomonas putida TaxID=303 RepID=UPI0027612710|nr:plasmid partition protein ParG [Pseudomonas putida]MDP9524531.1 plasmid partition protein ParG [Pseudomonas putida]
MTPIDIRITGHRAENLGGDALPFWLIDFTLNGTEHSAALTDLRLAIEGNDALYEELGAFEWEVLALAIDDYVSAHRAELSLEGGTAEQLAERLEQLRERSNLDYDLYELPGDQGYELRLPISGAWRRVCDYADAGYAYRGLQEIIDETTPVLKRLNANIPESLHDTFKITCAQRKKAMGDVLIELIRDWCKPS